MPSYRARRLARKSALLWAALLLALATPVHAQTPVVTPTPDPLQAPDDINFYIALFVRLVGQAGWVGALLLVVVVAILIAIGRGMFAGISKVAEEGTQNQIKKKVTDRPPDISESERGYLERHVINECEKILLKALDSPNASVSIDLRKVYIPLRGRGQLTEDREARAAKRSTDDIAGIRGRGEEKPPLLTEYVEQHPRLVIVGNAGSGKSTFLKYLALTLAAERLGETGDAEDRWRPPFRPSLFPLYFYLPSFAAYLKEKKASATDLIHPRAPEALLDFLIHGLESADLTRSFLRERLDAGRCMILLDSLDEVEEGQRATVLSLVERFVGRYGEGRDRRENRLVVASRPQAYRNLDPLADFEAVEILPFAQEQISVFVPRFYHELYLKRREDPQAAAPQAQALLHAIPTKEGLAELSKSPLLLTLMILIHDRVGLPDSRRDLYRRCVELLLMDWEKTKTATSAPVVAPLPAGVPAELKHRIERLQPVAFELLQRGTDRAPLADWVHIITDALKRPQTEDEAQRIREFLDWAVKRSALIEKPEAAEDVYGFAFHKTFREYLAACHLAHPNRLALAYPLVANPDWYETLRLLAQEVESGDRLEFLSHVQAEPTVYGPILVGECLLEIDDPGLSEQLRMPTLAQLNSISIDLGQAARDRAWTGRLLARLGDDRPGVGVQDGIPDIDWCAIPAGEFRMGSDKRLDPQAYDNEIWTAAEPQRLVHLPAFRISRYPITVAQFRPFVLGDGYTNDAYWTRAGRAWQRETNSAAPRFWDDPYWTLDNHPVVGVSWYEAYAYTNWLNAQLRRTGQLPAGQTVQLPGEAQWEKAARGVDGRIYPWGNDFDSTRLNAAETGINRTSAVGVFPLPDGPWGDQTPLDMSGNVREWCSTKWANNYTAAGYGDDGPEGKDNRVVRGGAWVSLDLNSRCAFRLRNDPDHRNKDIGFRVILAPPTRSR